MLIGMVEGQIKAGDITVKRPHTRGPYLILRAGEGNTARQIGNDKLKENALQKACAEAQRHRGLAF
jgi:hypothetical protein